MKEQKIKSIAAHTHMAKQSVWRYSVAVEVFFSFRKCIREHTQTIMPTNRSRELYEFRD